MTATTSLAGITASMTPSRVHLSCVEAFAQVRAASRQRLAGVSWADMQVGSHGHDHHSPKGLRQYVASHLGQTHRSALTDLRPNRVEGCTYVCAR